MNLPIKYEVPQLPQMIEIESNWIDVRENILTRAVAITEVRSQSEYNDAEIILKAITKHSNDLEKHRKELAKPFQTVDKKIKALADEAREKLEEEKENLKKKMAAYVDVEREKQQKELEEKAAAMVQEQESNPFAAFVQPQEIKLENKSVIKLMSSVTAVWKFEITDAVQVPREFCSPDERKIREYVQREKEAASIPGVRIYEETQIKAR